MHAQLVEIEEKNIRVAINGIEAINEYCENNDLSKIKDTLQFMEKKRFSHRGNEARPIDVRDYNFRVNLKEENIIKTSSKRATSIIADSETLNKFYRYKKRF